MSEKKEIKANEDVKEMALDLKVDLAEVEGSGEDGEILEGDVLAYLGKLEEEKSQEGAEGEDPQDEAEDEEPADEDAEDEADDEPKDEGPAEDEKPPEKPEPEPAAPMPHYQRSLNAMAEQMGEGG